MSIPSIAPALFNKLLQLHESDLPLADKIGELKRWVSRTFLHVTEQENLSLPDLATRIAYTFHRYDLEPRTQFYLHEFRKLARKKETDDAQDFLTYHLGMRSLTDSIAAIYDAIIPDELSRVLQPRGFYKKQRESIVGYNEFMRVLVVEILPKEKHLVVRPTERPDEELRVQYGHARNEKFDKTIQQLRRCFELPAVVNLVEVQIDRSGVLLPAAFVLAPDYLVDVSAISYAYPGRDSSAKLYLYGKYDQRKTAIPLLRGNIVNMLLDELMHDPDITFKTAFKKAFPLYPLQLTTLEEKELRDLMSQCKGQFDHLRKVLLQDFQKHQIATPDCYLEPTFFSRQYGIQGRLDVFHRPEGDATAAIVELKSGKPFFQDRTRITRSHYIQTLLYDLLIRSVYGKRLKPANYILYSKEQSDQMRFATVNRALQYDALATRNALVAIEFALASNSQPDTRPLQAALNSNYASQLNGFNRDNIINFNEAWIKLDDIERAYLQHFSAFIAREQQLAKVGRLDYDGNRGQSGLWLTSLEDKTNNFDIIAGLRLEQHDTRSDRPAIVFRKTDQTSKLANFRAGDIAVLYPFHGEYSTVMDSQIFRVSISELTDETVTVTLRNKQFNTSAFEADHLWSLEHDHMDKSFTDMHRSLYGFLLREKSVRDLYLTRRAPAPPIPVAATPPVGMTHEQADIFRKVLAAQDYFLLWGPPGTGKTSVMLRSVVAHLMAHSTENILLLAYTNRAVDEICEAVQATGNDYIRIGSRNSTEPRFVEKLLSERLQQVERRDELREVIDAHRIVISTVSSMQSRGDLFKLKDFDRVIIDEASQILEPMLVGLLPYFRKVLLIGDHYQLPAVVQQRDDESAVPMESLQQLGMRNLRHSLFERLYLRCQEEGWHHAYAQLTYQGRMHADLMGFTNRFYEGLLRILPEDISQVQREPLSLMPPVGADELECRLCEVRYHFEPCVGQGFTANLKVSDAEAHKIVQLVRSYRRIWEQSGREWDPLRTLGIITPYRAQIAHIRQLLAEDGTSPDLVTIDTVERYQGGARDIILISVCLNDAQQLRTLVSYSSDGRVDRKLNVALTRARQHLVVVGNPELMRLDGFYGELVAGVESELASSVEVKQPL